MSHLVSKRWCFGLSILTTLLLLSGCQQAGTDAAPGAAETPDAIVSQAAPEWQLPEGVVFGPGTFNFANAAGGLSTLSSYRATLILVFEGTQNGQSSGWTRTYSMSNQAPGSRQVTVETTGDSPDKVFVAEVNGAFFESRGESGCKASAIEGDSPIAEHWEPASFLSGVIGAEEAGSETVNGVPSDHYTFDERALGQSKVAKSTGEMWVASDGGYIVKYVATTQGEGDYFGEGNEGTLTWDYALTDIDTPVSIDLPEDCPPGMVDAPLLPGSTNIVNQPALLAFDTTSSPADAAAFYQKELPDLGWEPEGQQLVTDTSALLNFTQGAQTMMVIIDVAEGVTTVHIVLGL